MATITFYPLGNADCTLIEFADGRLMLVDYYKGKDNDDDEDKRVKLPEELNEVLEDKERDYFDVVVFTHRDSDHVLGADEFFWLEHAKEYQGEDRIKIKEIWVPACYILEEGLKDSARIIRQEARHRLKEGKGIRVFSQPNALDDWLRSNNVSPEERSHLITSAGNCAPGFTNDKGQAEIFIHAPFAFQVEDNEIDQNKASLVLHITFFEGDICSRAFFGADTTYDVWENIVYKTKDEKRPERLIWDIFKISHHCSYKALSEEKGKDITEPVEDVKYLFDQGQSDCYLISSSKPIPEKDTDQPPHKQAAAYYYDVADRKSGNFYVTMQTPTSDKPKKIVILLDESGPSFENDGTMNKLSPGGYTKRKEPSQIGGATFA